MGTTMTEDTGAVRIVLGSGASGRVIAIPFLLVGVWLAYHLVGGLGDLVTGRAAVGEMLVGTVLLAMMTAAFLVPGWLLLAARACIEIDRTAGTVTSVRDLRVYQLRERRELSDFSRLEVDRLSVAPNRQSAAHRYQVELAGRDHRNLVVGLLDSADDAMAFGRRLGALTGLPVEDLRETERPSEE